MSPAADIRIRAAEPADMAQVADVMGQPRAIWGTLQTPFTPVALREARFDATDPTNRMLVAELGGRIVGMAGLHRETHHRLSHAARIGMSVHDDFAGRGIGTALMSAVVELAERWWNIRRLELNVYADNTRAIALYERFGFQREGRFRDYAWRDGAYVDSLAMARLRP